MNNYQKLILRLNAKILKLAKRLSKNKLRQEKVTEQLNEVLSQIAEIKKKNAMANEILTNLKNEESYLQKITEKLFSKKQSIVHNYHQVLAMPSIAQKINKKFIAEPIMIRSRKRDINGSI